MGRSDERRVTALDLLSLMLMADETEARVFLQESQYAAWADIYHNMQGTPITHIHHDGATEVRTALAQFEEWHRSTIVEEREENLVSITGATVSSLVKSGNETIKKLCTELDTTHGMYENYIQDLKVQHGAARSSEQEMFAIILGETEARITICIEQLEVSAVMHTGFVDIVPRFGAGIMEEASIPEPKPKLSDQPE